jgi:hypothetical protein
MEEWLNQMRAYLSGGGGAPGYGANAPGFGTGDPSAVTGYPNAVGFGAPAGYGQPVSPPGLAIPPELAQGQGPITRGLQGPAAPIGASVPPQPVPSGDPRGYDATVNRMMPNAAPYGPPPPPTSPPGAAPGRTTVAPASTGRPAAIPGAPSTGVTPNLGYYRPTTGNARAATWVGPLGSPPGAIPPSATASAPLGAPAATPGAQNAPWGYGPLQKGRSWPQGPDWNDLYAARARSGYQ